MSSQCEEGGAGGCGADGADAADAGGMAGVEPSIPPGSLTTFTVGATVPTGFEHTAAEEVKEKIGADVRIGKDRGRIYFDISTDQLFQVRRHLDSGLIGASGWNLKASCFHWIEHL